MTNPHSTSIRLSSPFLGPALTLGLALLPCCQSAPTFVDDTAQAEAAPASARPATAKPVPASAGNNVDRAYLHA
ncbi:MAG: hypothetical protein V3U11_09090, partial [Planctomycetota bacterium]